MLRGGRTLALLSTIFIAAACSFSGAGGESGGIDAAVARADATIDGSSPDAPLPAVARVNVNGPAHTGLDFPGEWTAENGECTGMIETRPGEVTNTVDDALFIDRRFDDPVVCAMTVPSGDYTLTLLFAEIFRGGCGSTATSRIFTINIEGADVLTFDVMDQNNGRGCAINPLTPMARPVARSFDISVADGQLDFEVGDGDNGILSAFELIAR